MSTRPDSAVDHSRASGPPPVSRARWSLPSNQRGDITQLYLSSKSRFCGCGLVCWFHGCRRSTGLPSGSLGHEHLLVLPVVVVRAAEQDADAEVDVDQVVGDELAVDDDAGGDEHLAAPVGHVAVVEVADSGSWNAPQQPSRMRRRPTSS